MTVGDRIKETRIKKEISQTDLADKCGISKQTLYKYENNIVTNIPLTNISKISKTLNVSEAYLMGWEDANFTEVQADVDIELARQTARIKQYMLKFANLSEEKRNQLMSLIDMIE